MSAANWSLTRRPGLTAALAIALLVPQACDTNPSIGFVGTVVFDVTLSSLAVSSGTLVPAFDPLTVLYQLPETNDIGSITVTPTASNPAASIIVNSQVVQTGTPSLPIILPIGNSTINVVVKSPPPDTSQSLVYTINVSRAP
jgi:hypothetical protein